MSPTLLSSRRSSEGLLGNTWCTNEKLETLCSHGPSSYLPLLSWSSVADVMPECVVREKSPHAGRATRDLARTRAPRFPAITAGPAPAAQRMLGLPAVCRRTGYPGQARSFSISQPTKAGAVCNRARPPGRRALLLQLAVAALCVVCAGATLTGFAICPPPAARLGAVPGRADCACAGRTFHINLVAGRLRWLTVLAHHYGLWVCTRSQLCLQVYEPRLALAGDAGQRGLCDGLHAHVLVGRVAVSRRGSRCLDGRGCGADSDKRSRPVLLQLHRVLGRLPACGRQRAGDRCDSAGGRLCAREFLLPV